MKQIFILFLNSMGLWGCLALGMSPEKSEIRIQYPVGYPRVLEVAPECAKTNPINFQPCLVSALMMQSANTQLSTHRFLNYWEAMAFGEIADPQAIIAAERIIIPVLRYLYQFSRDQYSMAMLPEVNKILLTSRDSFDRFMERHQKNMAAYGRFAIDQGAAFRKQISEIR
jgi:hypothetical protein